MTRPPDRAAAQRATIHRAAEVLDDLARQIEQLGVRLCADPLFAERHLAALQTIDLIAQQQCAIATLLRAECPLGGIEAIGVDRLQQRLRGAS